MIYDLDKLTKIQDEIIEIILELNDDCLVFMPRQTGRTTIAINIAQRNDMMLIVPTKHQADSIKENIKNLEIQALGHYSNTPSKKIIVDNMDECNIGLLQGIDHNIAFFENSRYFMVMYKNEMIYNRPLKDIILKNCFGSEKDDKDCQKCEIVGPCGKTVFEKRKIG